MVQGRPDGVDAPPIPAGRTASETAGIGGAPQAPRSLLGELRGQWSLRTDARDGIRDRMWTAQRGMWRAAAWRPEGESDEDYRKLRPYTACRHHPRDEHVRLTLYEGRASLGGFCHCGRWGCPLCSALIAVERATDIGLAIGSAVHRGWSVWFPTWTMRHDHSDSLSGLLKGLQGATLAVREDRVAKRLREAVNARGMIFRQDVTHGGNGWHPHRHEFRFFDGADDELVHELLAHEFDVRSRYLERHGYGSMSGSGFKAERLTLDKADEHIRSYLAKAAGHELASANTKWGRGENRTPFQILHAATTTGDVGDALLIREYWHAIYRRTIIKWSKGLRVQLLGDLPERTDQEAADFEGNGIVVGGLTDWRAVRDWTSTTGKPGPSMVCRWAEVRAVDDDLADVQQLVRRLLGRFALGDLIELEAPTPKAPGRAGSGVRGSK